MSRPTLCETFIKRENIKHSIIQNWNLVEEIYFNNYGKHMELLQCYKCKEFCTFMTQIEKYPFSSPCMWCEKRNICSSCWTEVFYTLEHSEEEPFCSDECMEKYLDDKCVVR